MKQRIVLIVSLALSGAPAALAETPEGRQACTNDAFQFCQEFIPDRERVFQCLVAHSNVISAACHTQIAPSLPVEQAKTEAGASSIKHPARKPKTAKREAAVKAPAPGAEAGTVNVHAAKLHSTKLHSAKLHAGRPHVAKLHAAKATKTHVSKTHAAKTHAAESGATKQASRSVARREGKPLNIVPH